MALEEVLAQTEARMKKAVEALRHEAQSVRTGRATPSLVEGLEVEAYGTPTPLISLAAISAPEPRLIVIQAWDKSLIKAIEKAIIGSDLGLTPSNDGSLIRLSIPALTEERRKDLIKVVRHEAENARVAVRNVRRDAIEQLRKLLKDHKVAEDDERHAQVDVQKLTDRYIAEIDKQLAVKEADLLAV